MTAIDGPEAPQALAADRRDAVIVDVMLPVPGRQLNCRDRNGPATGTPISILVGRRA